MNYNKWFIANDYTSYIPDKSGCYAIYTFNITTKKRKLIYIGTAQNLYIRLRKHEVIRILNALIEYPNLIQIKCKVIKEEKTRIKLEKELIKRLQPKANL